MRRTNVERVADAAVPVKGSPGIGKRLALQHYANGQSQQRPAIFLDLSDIYHAKSPDDRRTLKVSMGDSPRSTQFEADQDESEQPNLWWTAVEDALGLSASSEGIFIGKTVAPNRVLMIHVLDPASTLSHATHSLRLIASSSTHGPTSLILTDVQLIFTGSQRIHRENSMQKLSWLHDRVAEGSIELLLTEGRGSGSGILKTGE